MGDKQAVVSVRMSEDLASELRKLAEERGQSVSDVLRAAAERTARESRPCSCSGLCARPHTATGCGLAELTVTCGCGTRIPSTITIG